MRKGAKFDTKCWLLACLIYDHERRQKDTGGGGEGGGGCRGSLLSIGHSCSINIINKALDQAGGTCMTKYRMNQSSVILNSLSPPRCILSLVSKAAGQKIIKLAYGN